MFDSGTIFWLFFIIFNLNMIYYSYKIQLQISEPYVDPLESWKFIGRIIWGYDRMFDSGTIF